MTHRSSIWQYAREQRDATVHYIFSSIFTNGFSRKITKDFVGAYDLAVEQGVTANEAWTSAEVTVGLIPGGLEHLYVHSSPGSMPVASKEFMSLKRGITGEATQ